MRRSITNLGRAVALLAVLAAGSACAAPAERPFEIAPMHEFEQPWALAFLPGGELLVTEMRGRLKVYRDGETHDVAGVPEVAFGGQGGLGDVVLHPGFADNAMVYLSYAEPGDGNTRGAAVARARLERDADGGGRLADLEVIWRQVPKVSGDGHYGHRIAFGPDGYLWISSGERQKMAPSQDMQSNLGKIVRLHDDGRVPADNPFADRGGVTAEIWSLGHRNPLGIAFDAEGRLWEHEMGPRNGDELNLVTRGANYGWPEVSNGRHYSGKDIPDHQPGDGFAAPVVTWTPVISPSSFIIYRGDEFSAWRGSGLIGGLSSQALVRVAFDGESAREAERFDMGARIRAVAEGPDGALWLLEDGRRGGPGRLLRLTAAP